MTVGPCTESSGASPGVVIVNQSFARRYFPDQEVLGKRLSVSGPQGPFLEIVGVARDGKYRSLFEEPRPFFSLPLLQHYQGFAVLLLRVDGDPRRLAEIVRPEILALLACWIPARRATKVDPLVALRCE